MQLLLEAVVPIVGGIVLILLIWAFWLKSKSLRENTTLSSKGPGNMRFVCVRCAGEFNHTKRTVAAWEKGNHRAFCDACHKKWRDSQPPKSPALQPGLSTPQPLANPSSSRTVAKQHGSDRHAASAQQERSGCLGMIAILVFVPVILLVLIAAT